MNDIRAVYFDAVGTVLFPEPSPEQVYVACAARHGAILEERAVRRKIFESYRHQEGTDAHLNWTASEEAERTRWFNIVAHALPEVRDIEACFADLWDHFAQPGAWRVPGAAGEAFARLQADGVVIGLASNFDARLLPIVAALPELEPLRPRCLVSSLVGWRKPSPHFFAAVVESAGCAPGQILFVGDDRVNDYEGAVGAGLRAVLLDPEDRQVEVPHRIRSLAEVPGLRTGH